MKSSSIPPVDRDRTPGVVIGLLVRRITTPVEAMHRAILDPWLRLGGRRAASVADELISVAYGSVRSMGSAVGAIADMVDALPTKGSDAMHAFANAVWDDERTRGGMTLRDRSGAQASSFPDPTGRLIVLVHGLGQTERAWSGLIDVLQGSGLTPVLVRYDSGRSVGDNAELLARLLDDVDASWTVSIDEIDLVGYSMGGLVVRKALDIGRTSGRRWAGSVQHIVFIAAPHLGSPIEKAARLASVALRVAPQSRPLSEFIESRSSGIKDLGSVLDAPRSFDGVSQHVVAGVATADRSHPLGVLVGDFVVRVPSASGEGGGAVVAADDVMIVGNRAHAGLLEDPAVHAQVLAWLES